MRNMLYFFSSDQKQALSSYYEGNKSRYKTWFIFTIVLPVFTFLLSIFINFFLQGFCEWGKTINNGSLPIISFGFITSGIIYMMEKIDSDDTKIYQIRERVMAIAVLLLFCNSSLFIFETTQKDTLNSIQHFIICFLSILLFILSISNSDKMFLMQKKIVEDDPYTKSIKDNVSQIGTNWTE